VNGCVYVCARVCAFVCVCVRACSCSFFPVSVCVCKWQHLDAMHGS